MPAPACKNSSLFHLLGKLFLILQDPDLSNHSPNKLCLLPSWAGVPSALKPSCTNAYHKWLSGSKKVSSPRMRTLLWNWVVCTNWLGPSACQGQSLPLHHRFTWAHQLSSGTVPVVLSHTWDPLRQNEGPWDYTGPTPGSGP